MPLRNTVRLPAVLAFAAVLLVGIGAKAQMSPIRHDPPAQSTPAIEPPAVTPTPAPASPPDQPLATSEATPSPAAALPSATSDAMPSASVPVPVYPVSGTSTPAYAVFLRAGPNTAAPVIGTLQPGMPLRVLASANYGWMQVASPVGTGWSYGSYLAP